MLVGRVKTYVVATDQDKDLIFVRVETSDGAVGWGECYTSRDREPGIASIASQVGEYLIGRSIFEVANFVAQTYLDVARKRGSMEFFSAVSGLEIALWDLIGKTTAQPVRNLLGGQCRKRVPVYANGWAYNKYGGSDAADEMALRAAELVRSGFAALKFDPFTGPWRSTVPHSEITAAVRRIAAVREAVGPDVKILIDLHRRLNSIAARRFCEQTAELDPFWIEEPVAIDSPTALQEVRVRSSAPIVSGETLYTRAEFATLLGDNAVDIVNPDIACCGGLLELIKIGAMAEAHGVMIAPHNYNSTAVALAATAEAFATMPNGLITEYFVNFAPIASELFEAPRLEDGCITLADTPGLGIVADEGAIERHVRDGARERRHLDPYIFMH